MMTINIAKKGTNIGQKGKSKRAARGQHNYNQIGF